MVKGIARKVTISHSFTAKDHEGRTIRVIIVRSWNGSSGTIGVEKEDGKKK